MIKLMLLSNLMFALSFVVLSASLTNLLNFMVSLEVMYLTIVCVFCIASSSFIYIDGPVFGLYMIGLAAADAVIGFYFVMLLFLKKQTMSLDVLPQYKN